MYAVLKCRSETPLCYGSEKASTTSSEMLWVDQPILLKRRMGNVGFNAFLKTLRFSNNLDLTELFSCRTCLIGDGNGNNQWTGVVIDGTGTGTGILNKLPRFHRPTHVVPKMKGNSSAQYIMAPFSLREFADMVFNLAKKYDEADMFNEELSSLTGKHRAHSADAFFGNLPLTKEFSCAYIPRLFIQGFFSQVTIESNTDGTLTIRHVFMNQDIRRDVIEFGRCFVSGSICGGVTRWMVSVAHGNSLVYALTNFGFCSYKNVLNMSCEACCHQLGQAANSCRDITPFASCIVLSLLHAFVHHDTNVIQFREISVTISSVIQCAITSHQTFFHVRFKQSNESSEHSTSFRDPCGTLVLQRDDWLDEASKTG